MSFILFHLYITSVIISLIGLLIGVAFCLLTILTRSYETRNAAGVSIGMTESEASGKSTGTLKPRWFECEAALLPPQGDLLENQPRRFYES